MEREAETLAPYACEACDGYGGVSPNPILEPRTEPCSECFTTGMSMTPLVIQADNLPEMRDLKPRYRLVYADPPFNTGKVQSRGAYQYQDSFDDYLEFLRPRLAEMRRLLTDDGSLVVHLDYREVHYVKVLLDSIFGRECFKNEIIWAYDYGGRSKSRWPAKHDNLLWYVKDPKNYVFGFGEMDRIPYMAPGLVGPDKAARGKTPTDVWWHTVVHTTGKEKTGYPTQKPVGILKRLVKVHTRPGDIILDPFAGSGSMGAAAMELNRWSVLIDNNPQACEVMRKRFAYDRPT